MQCVACPTRLTANTRTHILPITTKNFSKCSGMHYMHLQTIQCFSALQYIGENDDLAKDYFVFLWMKFSCLFPEGMYLQGSKLSGEHCALKCWSFHDFSTSLYSNNITWMLLFLKSNMLVRHTADSNFTIKIQSHLNSKGAELKKTER